MSGATWYKTSTINDTIVPVVVLKATEHFVTIVNTWTGKGTRREAKRSGFENYFETYAEARAHLIALADRQLANALSDYERASARAERVRQIRETAP